MGQNALQMLPHSIVAANISSTGSHNQCRSSELELPVPLQSSEKPPWRSAAQMSNLTAPGPRCRCSRAPAKARPGVRDSLPHTHAVNTNSMCGFLWCGGTIFYCVSKAFLTRGVGNQTLILLRILFPVYLLLLSGNYFQQWDSVRSDRPLSAKETFLCNLRYCNQVGYESNCSNPT